MKYLMLVIADPSVQLGPDEDEDVEPWVTEMDGRGIRLLGNRLCRPGQRDHRAGAATASCCSPTARSPRPRSRSPGSTSSSAPTSTRRSRSRPSTRWPGSALIEVRPFWPDDADVDGRTTAVAAAFREEWGRIVATADPGHRRLGPGRGVRPGRVRPALRALARATACRDRPGAWLTTTARNRAIDRLRRGGDRGGQAAGGRRAIDPEPTPAGTSPTTAASRTTGCG